MLLKQSNEYSCLDAELENYMAKQSINLPKTRASKIIQFKHYQTDAPV